MVFETERLRVRTATAVDADLLYELWHDPQVMGNVGFPQGLRISREEIAAGVAKHAPTQVFDRYLIVELQATGEAIGECKLGSPDETGIAETDVKLLPRFWGHKYGIEVKRELVDYLFQHTDCTAVQATPNINNIASINMQEAVGGVRVGEGVFEPPEAMRGYMTAVPHYIYRVYR
ncbi:MAG: GNAT family N-acetyltransferase [Ardenticatenaceae bacterium]|nr:GNAT family N-acetyltransferase [Ardenticatenaceae bacterium]MCB9003365.1 GNAT family N-acetyltransferase [Ardenticatenaceae bacterium]